MSALLAGAWSALPVPPALLGESPFWHPDEAALYWCDIPGKALHRWVPATAAHTQWAVDSEPASCAPLPGGDLLLACRDGLFRFSPQTGKRQRLARPPYDTTKERFNDGKADPQGRFWVGTIYEPRQPPNAALYRWALGRLAAYERNRHERRVAAAAGQFAALQAQDALLATAEAATPASPSTLDLQQLDTVPAELLNRAAPSTTQRPADSADWLAARTAGDWLRIFLHGSWVQTELLWTGAHGQLWLLAEGASQRSWVVRRGALVALYEAALLDSLQPRSLLRSAARRVRRQIEGR